MMEEIRASLQFALIALSPVPFGGLCAVKDTGTGRIVITMLVYKK